jgi:hypothetical protein
MLRLTNFSENYIASVRLKGTVVLSIKSLRRQEIGNAEGFIAAYLPPGASATRPFEMPFDLAVFGFVSPDDLGHIEADTSGLAVESAHAIIPDRGKAQQFLMLNGRLFEGFAKPPDEFQAAAAAYAQFLGQPASPSQPASLGGPPGLAH